MYHYSASSLLYKVDKKTCLVKIYVLYGRPLLQLKKMPCKLIIKPLKAVKAVLLKDIN